MQGETRWYIVSTDPNNVVFLARIALYGYSVNCIQEAYYSMSMYSTLTATGMRGVSMLVAQALRADTSPKPCTAIMADTSPKPCTVIMADTSPKPCTALTTLHRSRALLSWLTLHRSLALLSRHFTEAVHCYHG